MKRQCIERARGRAVLVAAGSLAAARRSPPARVPVAPRRARIGSAGRSSWPTTGSTFSDRLDPTAESEPRCGRDPTRTCSCARSSATTTSPAPPGRCSCPISPCASRLRRTAAGRTRSRSSAASASGRRSTARSPQPTSATRSSGSRGSGAGSVLGARLRRHQGVRRLPLGPSPVDLRHLDAEREDDRLHPHAAGRRLPPQARAAGGRADPTRGRHVLREPSAQVRNAPDLVGPVHDRRGGRDVDPLVHRAAADAWALAHAAHARPQPALRPANRQHRPRGRRTPTASCSWPTRSTTSQSSQAAEAARRLAAGELEDAYLPSFWPVLIRRYAREADERGRLQARTRGASRCGSR